MSNNALRNSSTLTYYFKISVYSGAEVILCVYLQTRRKSFFEKPLFWKRRAVVVNSGEAVGKFLTQQ